MLKFDLGGFFNDHFCRHLKYYLIICVFVIGGIILGIISANNISVMLTTEKIKLIFFRQIYIDVNFFAAFFLNTFIMLVLFLIIIAVSTSIFLLPIGFVLIIYRGYLAGFAAVAIIRIFGAGGIINLIIIFIPFQLMLLFFLTGCMAVCMRRLINNIHCGSFCFRGAEYEIMIKELISFFIIFIIVNLLLSLIAIIITKTFVVAL